MVKDKFDEYIGKFIEHLEKSLFEDLKESIPKTLTTIVDVKLKGIKEGLEPLAGIESVQREQADMIENLQISYKHLSDEFDAFRQKTQQLPNTVKETIDKQMDKKQDQLLDVVAAQLEATPSKPVKIKQGRKWNIFSFIKRRWF